MNHLPKNTRRRGRAFVADARQPAGKLIPLVAAIASLSFATAAHAQAQETTLSTVTVKADAQKPDGHLATKTRVGKVVQDPHDVPQAITTVTRRARPSSAACATRTAYFAPSQSSIAVVIDAKGAHQVCVLRHGFAIVMRVFVALCAARGVQAQFTHELQHLRALPLLRTASFELAW